MKKLIIILFALVGTYLCAYKPLPTLELKSSYFFFTHEPLRNVYKNGGFEESLSASFSLWKWFNAYASIGIAYVNGRSLNDCQRSSLLEMPIDLGLKIVCDVQKKLDAYLAFGGRYAYLKQHNDSLFVDKNVHQHCGGFFVNGGLNIFATDHWLIGIFGEYAYSKTSIKPCKPNVFGASGLRIDNGAVGISIGYAF